MKSKKYEALTKEEFIARHKIEWEIRGKELQDLRRQLGVSRRYIADSLGVSETRIRNLEVGNPVSDSKLLIAAYKNFIKSELYYSIIKSNALFMKGL
ncbi:helix-turn-helix domain-containing protein [Tissierella sp.]|uniref:helix-turn-helix domain-containing protein n=1 Tax=Tissierella sp. TaxID=41274 RepID=UPI0030314501